MDKDKEQYYLNIIKRASDRIKGLAAEVSLLKTREPIAVIGLGCRFPGGANSPEAFWKILSGGIDTIGEIPSDRWDKDAYFDGDPDAPGKMYTRFGGFIDRVDWLDTAFFGISPREAESLDPQQRLLMEVSWEALEHAGLNPLSLKGSRTGVFIGICSRDYIQAHLGSGDPTAIDPYSITGVAFSTATGRLSYLYDFRGPSIAVDTACSSSLVSLHLAVQSLINRESDCALAGGVSLMLTPEPFIGFSRLHAISADGRCRSFDEDASGYARGEGCGIVILKRLSDAERDGDIVLAVLKGSAVNQDGESSGLTAPNGLAQQDVILRALESAGINPDEVGYVEAHGTGTKLGDPIECRALGKIFDGRKEKLPIGSVKSNIGHLEAAAGIAGLIKVILALQKGMIPRSLHFNHPNSHIPWNEIPLRVITEALPWERQKAKRIAGVSSFGFSGTNAHVIVVEAPEVEIGLDADNPEKMQAGEDREYILPLSAKTDRALRDLAMLYERYLHDEGAHYPIRDICGTAALCRMHFDHRLCVTGKTHEELRDKLRAYADGGQKEREQHGIPGRYVSGEDVSWTAECPKFRKVPLPTYPFQRERYWRELTRKRETEKISAGQGEDNKYALPCSAAERLPIYPAANESLGDAVLRELKALVFSVSGIPLEELHSEKNLFALGLDSIMLVQMRQAVERKFGVVFTMSQINNELSTLSRLAAYVEVKLPETVPGASLAKEALSPAPGVLQVVSPSPEKSTSAEKKSEAYVPFSSIASRGRLDLNKRQRKHLDDLIARYCTGTAHSKEMTQRYRSVFANVRNIAGFRREWKEMIYQIIVERASGSRIWDIDGREYLD
ncbi:MAG: beta-ketoacyl synthase N-terminal-like domain-containing protein, partial [Dissulfurispiraceae bacterium]